MNAAPQHVAVIMDGNGRWARARGLPRTAGHKKGADSLRAILEAARAAGVKYLTVYAFSAENWQRPPEEVAELMQLLKLYIASEVKQLRKSGVKLCFIGGRERLSADVREVVERAEKDTQACVDFQLTVALSYGSRQEIARACAGLVAKGEAITLESIAGALDTASLPEPDLLIRTGGEQRLSNFLLWQLAYTELYFTETLWPDFTQDHFKDALHAFTRRERRYGNAT